MMSHHFTSDGVNPILEKELAGLNERLKIKIEYIWQGAGVETDYINFLRQALPFDLNLKSERVKPQHFWILLPGLCCQAVGGESKFADDVAAAWLLFYIAAQLMDSVQDIDEPEAWWADLSPGMILNIASGLFFTATSILSKMVTNSLDTKYGIDIQNYFYQQLFKMCVGQHIDLYRTHKTLESFWESAKLKSGSLFALACRSGAQFVSNDSQLLNNFEEFGNQLGIMVQILDELEDWHTLIVKGKIQSAHQIVNTLPYLYTMSVLPEADRKLIQEKIKQEPEKKAVICELINSIEDSGSALYIITELERHYELAINAIMDSCTDSLAQSELIYIADQLCQSRSG